LSLPLLLQFRDTRPNLLFQPETPIEFSKSAGYAAWYLPAIAVTLVLAILVSKSFVTGSLFFIAFWGVFGILSAVGLILFKFAETFTPKSGSAAIVIKQILRERITSLAIFVILSVAFALTSLIPQLKEGLTGELQTPTG